MPRSLTADGYVDVRELHPGWSEQTCTSCGESWLQAYKSGETICPHCLMGQGDAEHVDQDEPTDYGALWYGDVSREEMLRQHAEMKREVRERTLSHHVETPYSGYGEAVAFVLGVDG